MLWILFCNVLIQSLEWLCHWINTISNLWITWNSWNMLLSVAKNAYFKQLLYNTLRMKYLLLKLFYSHYFLKYFQQWPRATLYFCSSEYRSRPFFKRREMSGHISCKPDRPTLVFFNCEMALNTARNAWFKVCGELLRPVFNVEKKPTFGQKLTCT